MVDLSDKGSSESEDMGSQSSETSQISTIDRASSGTQQIKTCVDCGTSKTPLWRGGSAGPKSLCNACGIKSRKKRRALLGLNKDDNKTKKTSKTTDVKEKNSISTTTSSSNGDESNSIRYGESLIKSKYFGFGSQMVALKQRPRSPRSRTISTPNTMQRKKLGEEEQQAAFLLMALSCGSVYQC